MGIKSNYTKALRQIAGDDIFKPTHISEFAYEKIAIDTTLFLYKFKAAMGDRWISGFLNIIKCFRQNLVHPVFIFDGIAPIEKREEQESRKRDREKLENNLDILNNDISLYHANGDISEKLNKLMPEGVAFDIQYIEDKMIKKQDQVIYVSGADFITLKTLFTIHNIPFFTSPTEAEKMCAQLCIMGHVKAVLSDDTDVIAYKCPITISKLNSSSGGCFTINHTELLEKMKFTETQFMDHCIMCGTDYNKNLTGIGSIVSYKYILEYGNIEEMAKQKGIDVSILDHENVRRLFTVFDDLNIDYIPFCKPPDKTKLETFFHTYSIPMNVEYYMSNIENKHIYME